MRRTATRLTKLVATLMALLAALLSVATPAMAARLKDLASVKGVRDNQLVGYGIVVGLNGTGDGKNAAFTTNGLANLMRNMGVKIDPQEIKVKNVASVIVTAKLPPFVKGGQAIDVTLSSVGDATSLQGGTLLATPMKGLDNQVYAIAQGAISIGGFEVQGAQAGRQKNHLTVARIPAGATVEQEVPVSFAQKKSIAITLGSSDFTTANRMVGAINQAMAGNYATAKDGATVEVTVPEQFKEKEIAFLATIENLEITPDRTAKVVLDERTGTVVMGESVRLNALALSHGNLSLQITPKPPTTPPTPEKEKVMVTGDNGQKLVNFAEGTSLGEVVRALNAVGVAPRDLIAIFQTMKASGALQAELEII